MSSSACPRWERRIKSWLDGEMDAGAARDLEAHLATCPECRRTASEFEAIARRIQSAAEANAPPPSLPEVRQRVRREAREARETLVLLRRVAAAAAAVLVAATMLIAWRESSADAPESKSLRRDHVLQIVLSGPGWEGGY